MRKLLDFDDAGAADDHPAKGVCIGDVRAWHDEMERMRTLIAGLKKDLADDVTDPLESLDAITEAIHEFELSK